LLECRPAQFVGHAMALQVEKPDLAAGIADLVRDAPFVGLGPVQEGREVDHRNLGEIDRLGEHQIVFALDTATHALQAPCIRYSAPLCYPNPAMRGGAVSVDARPRNINAKSCGRVYNSAMKSLTKWPCGPGER
jgi:hypothetical protein